jgi:integrase
MKISQQLTDILAEYINTRKLQPNDQLFKGNTNNYSSTYQEMRNRLADKLHDPTIRTIRLYDFRHYFATMEYARTRDILWVKQQMGHKHVGDDHDMHNSSTYPMMNGLAKQPPTLTKQLLIEAGFDYITEMDELKIFKKTQIDLLFSF